MSATKDHAFLAVRAAIIHSPGKLGEPRGPFAGRATPAGKIALEAATAVQQCSTSWSLRDAVLHLPHLLLTQPVQSNSSLLSMRLHTTRLRSHLHAPQFELHK